MTNELKEWCNGIAKLKDVMKKCRAKTVEMAVVFAKKLFPLLIDGKYPEPEVMNMRQWINFVWELRGDHRLNCRIAWYEDDPQHEITIVKRTVGEVFYRNLPFITDKEQDDAVAAIISEFLQEWKLDEEIKTEGVETLCDWIMRPPSADYEYNDLVRNIDELTIPWMKKLYPQIPLPTYENDSNGSISLYWRRLETEELEVYITQCSYGAPIRACGKDAKGNEYDRAFDPDEMDQLVGYLAQTYADIFQ